MKSAQQVVRFYNWQDWRTNALDGLGGWLGSNVTKHSYLKVAAADAEDDKKEVWLLAASKSKRWRVSAWIKLRKRLPDELKENSKYATLVYYDMNESLFVGDVKAGKLLEISEIDDVLQSYGKEIERQGVAGYEFTGEKGKKIYRRMRAVRGTPFSVYSSKTISGPLDPTPVDPKLNQKDSSVKGGDVESADRFDEPSVDKKVWREIVARQGQYRFRNALRDAYGNRCCISDSSIVELLEAAHIDPHSDAEDYSTNNGLLLRADFHTLFDRLLFALDDDQVIHISKRLMDSEYKQYHGKRINSPKLPATPSRLALGRS